MRGWLIIVLLCSCGRLGFDANDARPGNDGDGAAGDAGLAACNQIHGVHDDFASALDLDLWGATFTDTGTSVQTSGGEVILTPATNVASGTYCAVTTDRHYDLRGERFFAEITQVGTNGAVVGIQIRLGTQQLALSERLGMLRAAYLAPTYTTVQQRPYSPATDRFWSIAESAGTITWETSADGITFAPLAQAPAPFDVSLVRGQLFAGTESAIAAPGTLHVSSVGSASATVSPACSSDTLVDTFDTGVLDRKWLNTFIAPCCTMTPASGQLVVTTDGSPGYAHLSSAAGYDLRGRHVGVELVQEATQAGIHQALVLDRDSQNRLALVVKATVFDAYEVVNGTATSHTVARMPGERFLRIGESGGMYTAEVSVDRQAWRVVRTAPITFAYDNVMLELETGIPGSALSPETVIWDNFNTP